MRVLMFGWEFPPYNSGGLGVACQGLVKSLTAGGVDVLFVLPRKIPVNSSDGRFVFADYDAKCIPVDSILKPYISSTTYKSIPGTKYGNTLIDEVKRYAKSIVPIVKDNSFDIIHAHDWLSILAGVEAKKLSGKPLVVHVHATEYDRSGGTGVDQRVFEIEQYGMQAADRVIAVSEYTKNMVVQNYGVNSEKVDVVHNGFTKDLSESQVTAASIEKLKEKGNKIVLFVGRLTLQKGPDYFLKAAQKVLEVNPDVYFVIAGSGDMEGQIIEETLRLGIAEKVLFAGFVRGEELISIYKSADVFVMPSVSEPFGITALESLINGTPVLLSKQSGVAEVLKHTLKTDFWDVDDMASKILAVLDHKSLRDLLGKNGMHEAKGVTWEKAAQKCVEIYKDILNE